MSKLISEYSTKLKSFGYLSLLIIIISVTYMISGITSGYEKLLSQSVSIGLLGLFAGGFLFYFGQKKRTIQIYDDKIEYLKPKIDFSANWDEVVLVKSFKEINKETENLIIMKKDDDILSISTAFFDRNKLISAYNDIRNLQKNNEKITFEDDRLWGK